MQPTPTALLIRLFPGLPDLIGRVSETTLTQYQADLQLYVNFGEWLRDRVYDPATLRAWRTHMVEVEGRAAATVNRRLAAVKSVVRSCVTAGAIDGASGYAFSLVEPVRERTLTHRSRQSKALRLQPEEVRRICRIPDPTTLCGIRDRALLNTFAASGCRASEVIALRRSHLFWTNGRGTIEVLGKNQVRPRRAPLTREAYEWICRWLEQRARLGIDVDTIFTAFVGGHIPTALPLTRHGAYRAVKRAGKKAGIPDLKPHDFRRFVGSELGKRHGLLVAQRALGHKRPDTTGLYILDEPELEALTEGLW